MPRRPKCPDCPGAPTAVPLVFGLPDVETFEARDRGEVVLGGCMLEPGPQPRWACPECQNPLADEAGHTAHMRRRAVIGPLLTAL